MHLNYTPGSLKNRCLYGLGNKYILGSCQLGGASTGSAPGNLLLQIQSYFTACITCLCRVQSSPNKSWQVAGRARAAPVPSGRSADCGKLSGFHPAAVTTLECGHTSVTRACHQRGADTCEHTQELAPLGSWSSPRSHTAHTREQRGGCLPRG